MSNDTFCFESTTVPASRNELTWLVACSASARISVALFAASPLSVAVAPAAAGAKPATKASVAYVAATGKPYVLGMVRTGAKRGELVFSQFGTAKVPKAPSHTIDLSQLEQQAGNGSGGSN